MKTRLKSSKKPPRFRRARQKTKSPSALKKSAAASKPAQHTGKPVETSRTILVPLDLESFSQSTLNYAGLTAKRMGATILLFHVMERSYAGGLRDSWTTETSDLSTRNETLRKLNKAAALAKLQGVNGVPIKCLVKEGIPQHEILRLAESQNVSLIILTRRSRGTISRLLFGSTTGPVVDFAPCPVIVVPETERIPSAW